MFTNTRAHRKCLSVTVCAYIFVSIIQFFNKGKKVQRLAWIVELCAMRELACRALAKRKNAVLISICHYRERCEYIYFCNCAFAGRWQSFSFHIRMLHPCTLHSFLVFFLCATAAGYRPSVNKEKDIVCPLLNREVEREYYTGGDAYWAGDHKVSEFIVALLKRDRAVILTPEHFCLHAVWHFAARE